MTFESFQYATPRRWDPRRLTPFVERGLRSIPRRLSRGEPLVRREDVAKLSRPVESPAERRGPWTGGGAVLLLSAIPWDYRFQRPQQLARALAREGHPVLYVEGFLRTWLQPRQSFDPVAPGVGRLQLRIPGRPDPFRSVMPSSSAAALAQAVRRGLRGEVTAVVVQLPFWRVVAGALAEAVRAPLVYDRIDLHAGFSEVPPEVAEEERRLVREADLVSATSRDLTAGLDGAGRVELVPNAVDPEAFGRALEPDVEARADGEVRIGYVGALADWFDVTAVEAVARSRPSWRITLAGRVEHAAISALRDLPNVRLLGEIPYRAVPGFLADQDALLIPFVDSPLTRAVDPVKLYEALACGIPVVTRRLPGVEGWPAEHVATYDRIDEIVQRLEEAAGSRSPAQDAERRALVAGQTWTARARRLLDLVAEIRRLTRPETR